MNSLVSRISVRFMGEGELVEEARKIVREFLEKKGYYTLASPTKAYEASGEGNVRLYLEMAKREREKT